MTINKLWLFFLILQVEAQVKIVALVAQRNEQNIIANFLKHIKLYADALVVLDDASTDNSLAIIESLATECNIEKIIKKKIWYRDELKDRNALLIAGREIGGTHFICLDVDEMFTSNCLIDNYLRRQLLSLHPGEVLALSWHHLWKSYAQYRVDGFYNPQGHFCFCDDKMGYYESDFIHTPRTPTTFKNNIIYIPETYGVLHFQYINWDNLCTKQRWYQYIERIRYPERLASDINKKYLQNEQGIILKPILPEWFNYYTDFDFESYNKPSYWRLADISQWVQEYGQHFFSDLLLEDIP